MIKRMCARIVSNMSKLVEEPLEAAPFLKDLIPALGDAIDTIADPEARDVATKTHQALIKMDGQAKEMMEQRKFRQAEFISGAVKDRIDGDADMSVVNYVSTIASSLINTKTTDKDEYVSELTPFTNMLDNSNDQSALVDYIYDESQKVITLNDVGSEDDDDGELLCDCEFTLAYGTKFFFIIQNLDLKGI